jgi:hypothetical protein
MREQTVGGKPIYIRAPQELRDGLDQVLEKWKQDPKKGVLSIAAVARALLAEGVRRELAEDA